MQVTYLTVALALVASGCLAAEQKPVTALVSRAGQITLSREGKELATIAPGLFEKEWRGASLSDAPRGAAGGVVGRGTIQSPGGTRVQSEVEEDIAPDGASATLKYHLVPQADVFLNSLHVSMDFAEAVLVGGEYEADGQRGTFPAKLDQIHLRSAPTQDLRLRLADGTELRLHYDKPTPVLLQDNRQWGPTFSVRMGPQVDAAQAWPAGKALDVVFNLTASGGLKVEYDNAVTIEAGQEWVPLNLELDIVSGSALDFSGFGQLDPPAGKHGWLLARPDGQFAFQDSRQTLRRFCGVNLCFDAHYIAHDQADRLAERLSRLGYNAVRFHHFDGELVDRSGGTSTTLSLNKLDQLDYLFGALKRRGIYVTVDLFISRPVFAAEIWPGATGDVGMNDFKMLVPVNAKAFDNWKAFARNLLTHSNPYTGLRWADDPTLAWISMINEGNFGNYLGGLSDRARQDWQKAWNAWLAQEYAGRDVLAKAWGSDPGGDFQAGSVPLATNVWENTPKAHDLCVFLAQRERAMFGEMRRFLREEVGTKALLTNMNSWTNPLQNQLARQDYDYVDDHFYVDHPQFLEQAWRLPSRCGNTSPVAAGAPGGRGCAFTRLLDKPFTITEYNYSGPGRFRGVGGIITGCMAALQDWSGLWRFAYSHSRDNLFQPGTAGYFDLATDPLNQAAERASLCLFLRGDMRPAPHSVGIAMTESELLDPSGRHNGLAPSWNALALVTRVGTFLGKGPAPADLVLPLTDAAAQATPKERVLAADPYSGETGGTTIAELGRRGWLPAGNATNLATNRLQSETGELLVDGPRDVLVLNTPQTAGGYAPAGQTIQAGAVTVTIDETDATVWVSSVDGKPIAQSRRLLITHLTDLQNTGERFGERARKTLLEWGQLPHLVLAGRATVRLKLAAAGQAEVWALATSGRRLAKIEAKADDGELTVPLNVTGPEGARMLYEVVAAD